MTHFIAKFSAGVFAAVFLGGIAAAAPMSDTDKAAMKQANDSCKAQVNEQAKFHEMSLWAKHKAVKDCVKDALAHH
jgi:stress-induced morphogen